LVSVLKFDEGTLGRKFGAGLVLNYLETITSETKNTFYQLKLKINTTIAM
jgi:hypothetical protein